MCPAWVENEILSQVNGISTCLPNRSILDSVASEHSARLVAMQNATDNANELKQDLTLDLNKARQQQVTSEILDIVGGALALEE